MPTLAHAAPARSPFPELNISITALSVADGGDFIALANYDDVTIVP